MSSSIMADPILESSSKIFWRWLACMSWDSSRPTQALKAENSLDAWLCEWKCRCSPLSGKPSTCMTAYGVTWIPLSLEILITIVLGSSLSNKNFNSSLLSNLSAETWRSPPKPISLIRIRWLNVRWSTNELNADGAHRTVGAWAYLTGFFACWKSADIKVEWVVKEPGYRVDDTLPQCLGTLQIKVTENSD